MHRLLVITLVTGCSFEDYVDARLEGYASSPELSVEAYASFDRCDGTPCTSIQLDVRRILADASPEVDADVAISVDGLPAIAPALDPDGVHRHGLTVAGWIHHLRIDVTAGADTAALWADAVLTTPDAAGIELPARVVLGSNPKLTWAHQRGAAKTIIFAAKPPLLPHFGFVETFAPDDGVCDFANKGVFDQVGHYDVALHRELVHEGDTSNLSLTWSSMWQQDVEVVEPPPI